MHPGAFEFVRQFATEDPISVIEIGSRDINGSVRPHFPIASWIGIDCVDGPSVDVVADAVKYLPSQTADRVICCEVFEHTAEWRQIILRAYYWLKPGGTFIITCAGVGREPHSAIDGEILRAGESYENVSEQQMSEALRFAGFESIEVSGNEHWHDTYATAQRKLICDGERSAKFAMS